jgi:hypothetical protein
LHIQEEKGKQIFGIRKLLEEEWIKGSTFAQTQKGDENMDIHESLAGIISCMDSAVNGKKLHEIRSEILTNVRVQLLYNVEGGLIC